MKWLCLVLILLASGCSRVKETDEQNELRAVTLCIVNEAAGYGDILAYAGSTRFDVRSGDTLCKEIPATGASIALRGQTRGGGIEGPREYAASLPSYPGRCWRWRLSSSSTSSIDLMEIPCEEIEEAQSR